MHQSRRAKFTISNNINQRYLRTPDNDEDLFFPPVGEWAHVAAVATVDGAYTLYRNGETRPEWIKNNGVAPNPTSYRYKDSALGKWGNWDRSHLDCLDGALRDVRLYDYALPKEEIATLASSWDPPPPSDP